MIASVVLEEVGHHVNSLINDIEPPGDEGEIFSALVRGEDLTDELLQELLTEDDLVVIAQSTPALEAAIQWPDAAWEASKEWTDEAWDAISNWPDADWQETTEWTDEQWQKSTLFTEEQWQETITAKEENTSDGDSPGNGNEENTSNDNNSGEDNTNTNNGNSDGGDVTISEDLLETNVFRFQNSDRPGTYLFAGPEESATIESNFPNFIKEGSAFEFSI